MKGNRIDTIGEELKVIALGEIKPPKHIKLRKKDQPFWESIINTRARTTWTDADLCHAASLSRIFCDIEILARDVGKCKNNVERGENRKEAESLIKQSITLSRILSIHTVATQGRDTGKRTRKEKELLDAQPKDELLAGPVVQ